MQRPVSIRTRALLSLWLAVTLAAVGSRTPDPIHAQSPDSARPPAVYDVNSEKISIKEIDGKRVLELLDNVVVIHDDVRLTSDRGLHYVDVGLTYMLGNVVITQQTLRAFGKQGEYRRQADLAVLRDSVRIEDRGWEIECEEARFYRTSGYAWLKGAVVARDSATTLEADSLYYDRVRGVAEAFGDVRITNEVEGFRTTSRHGFYFRDTGEGLLDRDPRLIVDPDSPEPVEVVADTMRVYPDSGRAVAYYRVKIIKGNTVTQADSAALFDDQNRAELYGNPLAKQERATLSGKYMQMYYDEDAVNQIDIFGDGYMQEFARDSLVIGRDSWIRGDSMTLFLNDNTIDSIRVVRNAESEYFPDATPRKVEANYAAGDSMFFRFDSDTLSYVAISGRASGKYRYLDLLRGQTTDSLRAAADSSLEFLKFEDRAEPVEYRAKNIEYFADREDLRLSADAEVKYQGRKLNAEEITYFSDLQLMTARGEDPPELDDRGEKFYGVSMDYDLESGTGLVTDGSTQFQQGYYSGERVAKVGDDEVRVWNSRYTTCNLKEPHFHFRAGIMKVYPKDKVVSGPVTLYIGETPIAALPFLANNLGKDRRSGFLRPEFEFGLTKSDGRFIRNVGYYWATNDYMDFTFTGDFNENSSFNLNTFNRYKRRYVFDGQVDFDFFRDLRSYTNRWQLRARHNHTFSDNFSARGDFNFVSDEQAVSSIANLDDVDRVIDRQIRSTVNVSKRWDVVGLSASSTREQNLGITDPNATKIRTVLPSVSLSIQPQTLYFGSNTGSNRPFWIETLDAVRLSPSLSGSRTDTEKLFENREVLTARAGLALSSTQRVSFLNVQPRLSANYNASRDEFQQFAGTNVTSTDTTLFADSTFVDVEQDFTWNTGVSTSTNFYGTFYPNIGALNGIRHTVSPQASWTLTPAQNGRARQQSVSLSLKQSIDLKIFQRSEPADTSQTRQDGSGVVTGGRTGTFGNDAAQGTNPTTGEEQTRKISSAVTWTMSTSYNPEVPSADAWSNVSSRWNTQILGSSVGLTQTIDPYEWEVLNTNLTTNFRLNGTHPFGRSRNIEVRELNTVAAATGDTTRSEPGESGDRLGLEEGRLPWSVSVGASYSKSKDQDPFSTLNLNSTFGLTDAWDVSYNTSYDLADRMLAGQSFSITRNLHCWKMSFSRQKLGDEWQFYFKIFLDAHPEIYAEQGRRGLGGSSLGGGSFGF